MNVLIFGNGLLQFGSLHCRYQKQESSGDVYSIIHFKLLSTDCSNERVFSCLKRFKLARNKRRRCKKMLLNVAQVVVDQFGSTFIRFMTCPSIIVQQKQCPSIAVEISQRVDHECSNAFGPNLAISSLYTSNVLMMTLMLFIRSVV
ncbi:uncharacterized protein LOC121591484 [Anopheles merus]|uniref:uncharacterized protein LOC121591484 n=1 Tax=Anopheles merus TaxID=30066 RepID=UPI001BE3D962|nr:uncharacterized protein LOC121591484 [Anopheles merus]